MPSTPVWRGAWAGTPLFDSLYSTHRLMMAGVDFHLEGEAYFMKDKTHTQAEQTGTSLQDHQLGNPPVQYQSFAAVLAGNDEEAATRLRALDFEPLRLFHFQIDRLRQIVYRIRKEKFDEAEARAKLEALPQTEDDDFLP